jgi:PAS domain S-box-containing protein
MRSISRRLLVGLTVTVGMSAALTVGLIAAYEAHNSRVDLESHLDASVRAFAELVEPALWDMDFERAERLTTAFGQDPRIASITVHERSSDTTQTFVSSRTTDTALRVMAVRHGGEAIGEVRVAFDRGYYRAQVRRQVVDATAVSLIALVATLIGLQLLFRRLFRRPLSELSAVVRGYADGASPPTASAMPYREFAELGRVLDSMSAQIREQLAALGAANRELAARNRFLAMTTADVEPAELLAAAADELRDLLGAGRVAAELTETDGASSPTADGVRDGEVTLPIALDGSPIGRIVIERERPLAEAELGIAHAFAAQLASAIGRHRAHAAERLLRVAIEQLPESVLIADRDRKIVYVNPGFTATTGYTAEEAMGQQPRDLKRAAEPDVAGHALLAALDAGTSWVGRLTNTKKSGEVYFEQSVVTPVRDERGAVVNYVSIGRDVTAELQRDEQYRHAQRMEAVGQLAGGVAHDFNNMLGAVMLQLELLTDEQALPEAVQRDLQEMRAPLERAANLTRQLLAFSRRQAMQVDVHDLNRVVAELLRILSPVLGERIEVAFAPSPGALPLECDAGMVEQVIVNLCVNARDAMPDGGRLDIATRVVMHDDGAARPGRWACLEVRDTGTGMPPDVQSRIFEPFFTTKDVGQGTGLGLATSHGIVAQHGGWIDVDSAVGGGTTFRVYLPARRDAAPASTAAAPTAVARGNATVLVVEDEPLVRQMVSQALERLGHRVLSETNGPDALRRWAEARDGVDLVITDMVMPGGISGVQLVERMRESNPDVPAIVMSGYSRRLASDVLPEGIDFLAKPFSVAVLSKAVEGALGRGARRDAR